MRPRRHCAWCGGLLGPVEGERQSCTACGEPLYLNAAPCAVVLVVDDAQRVLLARRAIDPRAGLWDTPGGFCGPYETPEDAAVRELEEEAGIAIEVLRSLGHVSDRYGDDGDATLGCVFVARRLAGEPVAADDVAELRWFSLDALPAASELAFPTVRAALALLALDLLGDER